MNMPLHLFIALLCLLTMMPLSAQQPLFRGEEGEVVIARLGGLLPDTVTLVGSLQGMAFRQMSGLNTFCFMWHTRGNCCGSASRNGYTKGWMRVWLKR